MANQESEEDSGERPETIELAYIVDRACSKCKKNLEGPGGIIDLARQGRLTLPTPCPGCGTQFRSTHMTKTSWECGNCHTPLATADPDEERYCRHCGCILIYPDGFPVQKKGGQRKIKG